MATLVHFLRLVRWNNLFIIALSMASVWFFVNFRYLPAEALYLRPVLLIFLVLGTILIAAGGYIINDYFDIRIDAVNRPDTLIITNQISRRQAQINHILLSSIGFLINVWVAYQVGHIVLGLVTIGSIVLLWFYSTHFKRMSIVGNVIVAFLTAMSICQVLLFEPALYAYFRKGFIVESGKVNPVLLILGISSFAFMLNWMREIVKDMEDIKGDAGDGCKTFPIVYGLKAATNFVCIIGLLAIAFMLLAIVYFILNHKLPHAVLMLVPLLHLSWVLWRLPQSGTMTHYAMISRMMKVIMLEGLLLIIFLGK